ncbi:hypothetical protein M413DRAFT_211893 [Hebeloma cylindrosporum]|uniref:Uncharacterized protein n=1 Tax=Hebeloma cylindrosporum TaxID=76867 RepID=A0A0C3CVI3_HEBCY|nr:hypothetical protein M413DRAFT_211893 [Hebeloma cylindrosporum h7]
MELCKHPPPKELSPSFWDSEGKSPNAKEGLEEILSGIEHPLGRLLYTTGDVSGAVALFLSLLKGASAVSSTVGQLNLGEAPLRTPGSDKLYLDDFRVAFNYWKSTEPDQIPATNLRTPFKLCLTKQSSLRFLGDNCTDDDVWLSRQDAWKAFWKSRGGSEHVAASGKVSMCELFWMDLIMQNPLDAEINLSNVTLVVNENLSNPASADDFIEVEVIKEVTIGPQASISVPISLKSNRPAKLSITHAKYDFLSLLPTIESMASPGRRLHETALQRQQPTYAPDSLMQVEVVPSEHRLLVTCVSAERLSLLQGENKAIQLCLTNSGSKPINEVWMVSGADDEIWIGIDDDFENSPTTSEIIRSRNSLRPQEPQRIPLHTSDRSSILQPGDSMELPTILHAESSGAYELCLLFVFREDNSQLFHSTKLTCPYEVRSLLETSVSAQPSQLQDYAYLLDVHITNVSPTELVEVTQITSVSPRWTSSLLSDDLLGTVAPSQSNRSLLGASCWMEGSGSDETRAFVSTKLSGLLKGETIDLISPPPMDLVCSHISKAPRKRSIQSAATADFVQSGRRKFTSHHISQGHPYIASNLYPFIFPLYNPSAVDFVVFWKIPSRNISGHCSILGITLGAGHAALENIIEEAESAKVKRSMYAETRRENMEVLDAIRMSEWNTEMNPIVVSVREKGTILHNFANGPCQISLEFCLRNHSLTHPAHYTLKLLSKTNPSSHLLPPPYLGRLTFRGTIPPSENTIVSPKLCITRPGSYGSRNWSLETEVIIPSGGERGEPSRKRRYSEEPKAIEEEAPCITVCDIQMA